MSSFIVAWYGYVRHFHYSNMFQTECFFFGVLQVIFKFIFFVTKKKVLHSVTEALSSYVCFV